MVKTRDGYCCTSCRAIYDLLVVPDSGPSASELTVDDYRTLCRTCSEAHA
jgi:hypothetical protein